MSVIFKAREMLNSAHRNFTEYVKVEALKNYLDKRWSSFIFKMFHSRIMELPILSICSDSGDEFSACFSSATLYPRENLVKTQNS